MIYSYKDTIPQIPDSVFIAPNSTVIGDVKIGKDSSVWFNTVIRGDVNNIDIGEKTNIQDGSVLHVTLEKWPLNIGSNVTIGHGVVLHGCTVSDNCLIGMGATILDGAKVGEYCLVAAGSLILEGTKIPSCSLVAGVPAIVKRTLSDDEVEKIKASAARYVTYKNSYMRGDCDECLPKD